MPRSGHPAPQHFFHSLPCPESNGGDAMSSRFPWRTSFGDAPPRACPLRCRPARLSPLCVLCDLELAPGERARGTCLLRPVHCRRRVCPRVDADLPASRQMLHRTGRAAESGAVHDRRCALCGGRGRRSGLRDGGRRWGRVGQPAQELGARDETGAERAEQIGLHLAVDETNPQVRRAAGESDDRVLGGIGD